MNHQGPVRVLSISGSLRRLSSNTALVGAVARLAPEIVEVSIYRCLADLPPFNPDIDDDRVLAAVATFRGRLQACDAVLISRRSPKPSPMQARFNERPAARAGIRYVAFSHESRIGGHVILVQVSVRAKPDHVERLEQTLRHVIAEARPAPGCLRYDWYRSLDAKRERFVYAEFDSEEAFAQYRRGLIVKKIGEQLIPLLEARPSFKHFSATVLEQS
jgi:quinol monooxygenase YgiN